MSFWNTLRKVERIRFYVVLFIVGIFFSAIAGFILSQPQPEYIETEGVIQHIESYYETDGDLSYHVYVSYTDLSGTPHENLLYPSYDFTMKEGNTVTVWYLPEDPEEIQSPSAAALPYIFLAIGVIACVASVICVVKGVKNQSESSPFENAERAFDPALAEEVRMNDEPTREYYFHWTGKMNQSYILETPERQPIYEAVCDVIGVFKPYMFTFINHLDGTRRQHKVSHTVTTSYGGGARRGLSYRMVSSSGFKIDDVNNWDHLYKNGYTIEPQINGIKLNFNVSRYGVPVAFLEAAGANILRDDKQYALGDKLPGNGLYKVHCKESDIEGVFFACFCASRVEFF